jgi:HAD superfamily hydrolase (TIGR01549 family)
MKSLPPVISFDFWNTLASPNKDYSNFRSTLINAYSALSNEDSREVYKKLKSELDKESELFGTGLSCIECFEMLLKRLHHSPEKIKSSARILKREVQNLARGICPEISRETTLMLRKLQLKGYGICLVSNTNFISGSTLRYVLQKEYGVFFDVMLFSDEEMIAKPSVDLFNKAAKLMGVANQDVMHVGDNLICDVQGAKDAGMQTLHVKNPENTVEKINKYLKK